jgi:transcriptional regulator with XRE-family HTH domain
MKYDVKPLIKARLKKRLSRAHVAAGIGTTEQTIRNVENGKSQSEKTVFAISALLEVPMDKLTLKRRRAS